MKQKKLSSKEKRVKGIAKVIVRDLTDRQRKQIRKILMKAGILK